MGFTCENKEELAVTLAAMICADDLTADNLNKVVSAAGVKIAPYWAKAYASILEGVDQAQFFKAGSGGGGGGGAAPAEGGAAAAAAAPEPEPEEEEEEADMGFDLFD
mmetsp:Transcript_29188/g.40972  ORF Transcript_29188/g.40972 Transcript_29188/m.40972 type:complete len:107 (-) Transcript_29188:113-433(-)|eukprot:CAMPEP_0175104472 /NCGR_PEP_ID=MMETSP0086_2-20121207/9762_1 /TAXON_ID=136419 /ORGANISM="Unknown Unknown, Strain D1" /LENGTH=106 /DNA_ID=CAMNT_0016379899 /DNA_START=30 /DNA_END=350 /DNA_ORIENTATION=+